MITSSNCSVKNQSVAEKVGLIKAKIEEARRVIEEKRKEANADVERRTKAEWTIGLCNLRVSVFHPLESFPRLRILSKK